MNTIEDPMKSNGKLVLAIIISVCAILLFGGIANAEAA